MKVSNKVKFFWKNTTQLLIWKGIVITHSNGELKMKGWRFYQKPEGLELYYLKPERIFTFFLFIFFHEESFLFRLLQGWFMWKWPSNTPKHRKEQKMWCPVFQGQGTFFCGWGAPWRGCGNRTATLDVGVERPSTALRMTIISDYNKTIFMTPKGGETKQIAACNGREKIKASRRRTLI